MKTYILTTVIYFLCIWLTLVSTSSYDGPALVCFMTVALFVGGILLSMSVSLWYVDDRQTITPRGAAIGFPLSGIIYLSGYGFILLKSLI
jgi:ABC-type polysaccharide/polyol phosphate export permease